MTTTLATGLLPAEFALAVRIHREKIIDPKLLYWLRSPSRGPRFVGRSSAVAIAIEELLGPITKNSDKWQSGELRDASVWFGFAIEQIFGRVPDQPDTIAVLRRMVLSSLLPLYRALATDELSVSFTASRVRLSETLAVAATSRVLGEPFTELLLDGDRRRLCPDEIALEHLNLDIRGLAACAEELAKLSAGATEPDLDWLTTESVDSFIPDRPEWASPTLLWKLAGEIANKRASTLLPRSWADIPLPWQKVTDHWRKLERILDGLRNADSSDTDSPDAATPSVPTPPAAKIPAAKTPAAKTPNSNSASDVPQPESVESTSSSADRPATKTSSDDQKAAPPVEQTSAMESATKQEEKGSEERDVGAIEACLDAASANVEELSSAYKNRDEIDQSPADEPVDASPEPNAQTIPSPEQEAAPALQHAEAEEDLPTGCVSAAEVHGHNDPVFVGAVNRFVASCRKEARDVALATVSVKPDSDPPGAAFSLGDDGLPRWQGRLIEALSTSPDIDEVSCYVCSQSELLVTLPDAERNEAAQAIRECVQESISPAARHDSLATVDVPATFFIAVAACSRPGPQFTAQDLIAPCRDIFDAIVRRGNTAVKSKEVY